MIGIRLLNVASVMLLSVVAVTVGCEEKGVVVWGDGRPLEAPAGVEVPAAPFEEIEPLALGDLELASLPKGCRFRSVVPEGEPYNGEPSEYLKHFKIEYPEFKEADGGYFMIGKAASPVARYEEDGASEMAVAARVSLRSPFISWEPKITVHDFLKVYPTQRAIAEALVKLDPNMERPHEVKYSDTETQMRVALVSWSHDWFGTRIGTRVRREGFTAFLVPRQFSKSSGYITMYVFEDGETEVRLRLGIRASIVGDSLSEEDAAELERKLVRLAVSVLMGLRERVGEPGPAE